MDTVIIMIKLLENGEYRLIETRQQTKILMLDGKNIFAWLHATNIGEFLVSSHTKHIADQMLALGKYRLYEVKDETTLSDLIHLELLVGNGEWQGYLLPTGLPNEAKKRNRIIPTKEIITKTTH